MRTKLFTLFMALIAATALWASNVITYTATEKLQNKSLDIDEITFGAPIISHTFTDNIGTITVDGEITEIGDEAFYLCSALTSITIPISVKTIGDHAFCGCSGLTVIEIPNSVTTIRQGAFSSCRHLTSVSLPNSIKTIRDYTFCECEDLASIIIPSSVTTIGMEAFYDCESLTSIIIPNSVTEIGSLAFSGCYQMTSLTIGSSVKTIRERAFVDCYRLKKTNYTGIIDDWCKIDFANNANPMNESHNFYINDVEVKDLVIPEGVTEIKNEAFSGCQSLTSVSLPNSVTAIKSSAFFNCTGLTSIIIPSSVKIIDIGAFEKCSGLTTVTIGNSVTTIGKSAFYDCESLTSIIIPNSVTEIGENAFRYCKKLKKANYTGAIADWCKIDFGNEYANPMCYSHNFFINDVKIKDLVIPDTVMNIGSYAFAYCYDLVTITIGNSVTKIGNSAFYDCENISSITCKAIIPPACNYNCFYNVDKSIPVYVLLESVEAYKSAKQWKDFTDIRPITAQEVEVTEIEAEPTESTVNITWPIVVDAETYTIEIRLGDKLICSIAFNAQGQLLSINFNPAPGHNDPRQAPAATLTATGYQFTITGLNPGTAYDYSVTAIDAGGKTLAEHKGNFSTTGGTGFESVHDSQCTMHKVLRNGQILLERNNATYTLTGQKVK